MHSNLLLFAKLQIQMADIAVRVAAKRHMGDLEIGTPVFVVGLILSIRTSLFLGLSRSGLRAESTCDDSACVN